MSFRVATVTLSDKGSVGQRKDLSGPAIEECLSALPCEVVWRGILPDEQADIERTLIMLCDEEKVDLVLTTGGTGLTPRDVTPEATLAVAERIVPGIPEAMRMQTMVKTSRAMLSRGAAVIRGRTLIINLPGSPKAVRECMEVVLPVLEHAVDTVRGSSGDCAR